MIENTPNYLATDKYPIGGARTTGKLCISSNPSGALVYVDGIVMTKPNGEGARTNTCISVIEGRRDIVLRLEGYKDHGSYADIFPGRSTSIYINMESTRGEVTTPLKMAAGLYFLSKVLL